MSFRGVDVWCVDVEMKERKMVLSIECPFDGKYEITRYITKLAVGESRFCKATIFFCDEGEVRFQKYHKDPGEGLYAEIVCYITPTYPIYGTTLEVWDKVVALLP